MAKNWYLACYKRGVKNLFILQLTLQSLEINNFVPMVVNKRRRADHASSLRLRIEPLFSNYVFIQFDPERTQISDINHCHGFSHFVRFGTEIIPLKTNLIDSLTSFPTIEFSETSFFKERHKRVGINHYEPFIQSLLSISNKQKRGEAFLFFCHKNQSIHHQQEEVVT